MRTIYFILYKEFRQIFRNRALLPIIFAMPIIQLIVLAYAADFEVRNLKLYWVDRDQSAVTQRLHSKFEASPYFVVVGTAQDPSVADLAMARERADLILELPAGFERDLFRENQARLGLTVNAIDGIKGGLGAAYATQVVGSLNRELMAEYGIRMGKVQMASGSAMGQTGITYSNWFNPRMDYKTFMVPGILGMLVTMIGAFLTSMNIVREKEMGTIEQLNVTPIKKYQFIIGKMLPFWLLALFDLAVGLVVAKLLYDVPFVGSVPLLFGYAAVYLLLVLGFGLLISTITETQQQAVFISWFFLVIFIFLSGFFTAIENMPAWAQAITYFDPVRYFMEVVRMVMLKGSDFY
ncbi:MAG: ABC transporter permease, partial [Bacteroidetes bacterium]